MRNLPVLFLLLFGYTTAHGQTFKSPLPVDSLTRKVMYQGVVQVPGATQAELYSRAREWFVTQFSSAKSVLEMDDRELGKLIGKGYAQFEFNSGFGRPTQWAMWRTIKIEAKDGRYRYTISGFGMGGPVVSPSQPNPLEAWLAGFERSGKPLSKMAEKMADSVTSGVEQTTTNEIASLRKALAAKPNNDF